MSYFVFDMDETLAELYTVYYFVSSLKLKETFVKEGDYIGAELIPDSLSSKLDAAYKCFINRIVIAETSSNPLGILRPGILNIMKRLSVLQKSGKVKAVIIYSNNGHLQSLEFIRDLIHARVGNDKLIKECIHWNHPMREDERISDANTKAGGSPINKTWPVLKNIMINGECGAPDTLDTHQVHFFDDLNHINLHNALGDNYHQVPAYTNRASFDRIATIYKMCVRDVNINRRILLNYVLHFFENNYDDIDAYNELDMIVDLFRENTENTENRESIQHMELSPSHDKGIEIMHHAVNEVSSGGKRDEKGGTGKRRRTSSKNPKKPAYRKTARKIEYAEDTK